VFGPTTARAQHRLVPVLAVLMAKEVLMVLL
jgi:hypothetical protein